MEQSHIVIIGAGVVGLAIAARLSADTSDIILLERHDGFGRETSSRNSEVIHGGFYYPADSLKARLCVRGNRMLYDLCAAHGIPHRRVGKIVIASSEEEIRKLHALLDQGKKNGVPGLDLLSQEQVARMEPAVRARLGLYSPSTGIVDTHALSSLTAASNSAPTLFTLIRSATMWTPRTRRSSSRPHTSICPSSNTTTSHPTCPASGPRRRKQVLLSATLSYGMKATRDCPDWSIWWE